MRRKSTILLALCVAGLAAASAGAADAPAATAPRPVAEFAVVGRRVSAVERESGVHLRGDLVGGLVRGEHLDVGVQVVI